MSGFVRVNRKVSAKPGTSAPPTISPPAPNGLGSSNSLTQPVQLSQETKQQQRLLSKVAATAQVKIPNGCKPWVSNQYLTSIGIKDLDSILGGGLPLHTISSLITDVRTQHSDIFTKVHLWEGYMRKQRCVYITNKNPQQAVYFSQGILKPALTHQKEPKKSDSNPNIGPQAPSITKLSSNIHKTVVMGIDDDDDVPMKKPSIQGTKAPEITQNNETTVTEARGKKRITQGSVANALNNDENDKKLTIAWQYDKYANRTMDDSNLSGINDEVIDDDEKNDNPSDNEDNLLFDTQINPPHSDKSSQNDILLHSPLDTSEKNMNEWKTAFDFHVISPHSILSSSIHSESTPIDITTPSMPQSRNISAFAPIPLHLHRFHLLHQLSITINSPVSDCHLKSSSVLSPISSSASTSTQDGSLKLLPNQSSTLPPNDGQVLPIVPSRIVFELTPELLFEPTTIPPFSSTPQQYQHYRYISVAQFFYTISSLISTTPSLLTFIIPPQCANNPIIYSHITNTSSFISSLASFTSQTMLSHNNISQSQIGSAASLFGDKHDGLYTIHQFPRQNTPSFSYKLPDSTLFLYRLKKQLTATITSTSTSTIQTLGIAKLVLPPEVSRSGDAHSQKSTSFASKDLFDEAVDEITKRAVAAAATVATTDHSPENNQKNNQTHPTIPHNCPTCGKLNTSSANADNNRDNKFSMNNTAKQHQQLQHKHNDMAILEEEEEEEEEEEDNEMKL